MGTAHGGTVVLATENDRCLGIFKRRCRRLRSSVDHKLLQDNGRSSANNNSKKMRIACHGIYRDAPVDSTAQRPELLFGDVVGDVADRQLGRFPRGGDWQGRGRSSRLAFGRLGAGFFVRGIRRELDSAFDATAAWCKVFQDMHRVALIRAGLRELVARSAFFFGWLLGRG